jgi:hypothetical protein
MCGLHRHQRTGSDNHGRHELQVAEDHPTDVGAGREKQCQQGRQPQGHALIVAQRSGKSIGAMSAPSVCQQGLEAVVAKRERDPYRPGERSWVKTKNREPPGSRRNDTVLAVDDRS